MEQPVRYAKQARYEFSKAELKELELMAKRRKVVQMEPRGRSLTRREQASRLKGKVAQVNQQSEVLLQVCSDWAREEHVRMEDTRAS